MIQNAHGEFFEADPLHLEKIAAWVIIQHELPIRGKELRLLRGALDLSLAKFARNFDKDSSTILKWERNPLERISLADELLIRLFVAKEMNISLPTQEWNHIQTIARKELTPIQIQYERTA